MTTPENSYLGHLTKGGGGYTVPTLVPKKPIPIDIGDGIAEALEDIRSKEAEANEKKKRAEEERKVAAREKERADFRASIDLSNESLNYELGSLKLGQTWLALPPESLSFQRHNEINSHMLLRGSDSVVERTGYQDNIIAVQGRLTLKQYNETLLPILAQFACCPFLPVRNIDIELFLKDRGIVRQLIEGEEASEKRERVYEVQQGIADLRKEIASRVLSKPETAISTIFGIAQSIAETAYRTRRGESLIEEFDKHWDARMRTRTIGDYFSWNWPDAPISLLREAVKLPVQAINVGIVGGNIVKKDDHGGWDLIRKDWVLRAARLLYEQKKEMDGYRAPLTETLMEECWVSIHQYSILPDYSSVDAIQYSFLLRAFNHLPYTSKLLYADNGQPVDSVDYSYDFYKAWSSIIFDYTEHPKNTDLPHPWFSRLPNEWAPATVDSITLAPTPGISRVYNLPEKAVDILPATALSQVNYEASYVEIPLEGQSMPTLQWMGGGSSSATILFTTNNREVIEALQEVDSLAAKTAKQFTLLGQVSQYIIKEPMLNSLGVYNVEVSAISISSVGPDSWQVELIMHKASPKYLSTVHKTQRMGGASMGSKRDALIWAWQNPDAHPVCKDLQPEPMIKSGSGGVGMAGPVDPGGFLFGKIPITIYNLDKFLAENNERARVFDKREYRLADMSEAQYTALATGVILEGIDYFIEHLRDYSDGAQTDLQRVSQYTSRYTKAINESRIRYGSTLPEVFKEIWKSDYEIAARGGHINLYPDFPAKKIEDAGATPALYYNYDLNTMAEENPEWWMDPWHFLYVTPRINGQGLPAEIAFDRSEAIRRTADILSSMREDPNEGVTDQWAEAGREPMAGGAVIEQAHSNNEDLDAINRASQEIGEGELDIQVDLMNLGTVYPNEENRVKESAEKAREFADLTHPGVAAAFPTFYLIFVEKDAQVFGYYDDFYHYQAIKELHLIRRKDNPMDVAYVTVSNVFNNLSGETWKYIGKEREYGMTEDTDQENPGLNNGKFPLQVGVEVMLRVGYGNHPDKLPTVFTGIVAEIHENRESGKDLEIVLQGYGAELMQPINQNDLDRVPNHGNAREYASLMLTMDSVFHFGRLAMSWWKARQSVIKGATPAQLLAYRKTGIFELMGRDKYIMFGSEATDDFSTFWSTSKDPNKFRDDFRIDDINIWLPNLTGGAEVISQTQHRTYNPFMVHGYSPWAVLQEITLNHPGTVVGVRPYDNRATLFLGMPDMPMFTSSRVLETYNIADRIRSGHLDANTPVPEARLRPFRNYHVCRSGEHLIRNELSTTEHFYNRVVLAWDNNRKRGLFGGMKVVVKDASPADVSVNEFTGRYSDTHLSTRKGSLAVPPIRKAIDLDINTPPHMRRVLYVEKRNVDSDAMEVRYHIEILRREVSRAYLGRIHMRANTDIWPNDIIMLYDHTNRMYGPIEASEVILHMDRQMGLHYEIRPNVVTSVHDLATNIKIAKLTTKLAPSGLDVTMPDDDGWSLWGTTKTIGVRTGRAAWGVTKWTGRAAMGFLSVGGYDLQIVNKARRGVRRLSHLAFAGGSNQTKSRNHPISVFPLMYEGRPFWPMEYRGNLMNLNVGRSYEGNDMEERSLGRLFEERHGWEAFAEDLETVQLYWSGALTENKQTLEEYSRNMGLP